MSMYGLKKKTFDCWCGAKMVQLKRKVCETTAPEAHNKEVDPERVPEYLKDIPRRENQW